jgi:hypothetical protein
MCQEFQNSDDRLQSKKKRIESVIIHSQEPAHWCSIGMAVTKVDHRPIRRGVMGPITAKFRVMFDDLLRTKNPKYKQWNVKV